MISLRFLARNASATGRLNVPIPTAAATATSISRYRLNNLLAPCKRSLHTHYALSAASTNPEPVRQISSAEAPDLKASIPDYLNTPEWRHPRFGFLAADLPHLIYIKLPRTAKKDDVEALVARAGLQNAQIFMYHYFETGKPGDFCFLKVADKNKVDATIATLSRFTLLGSELTPQRYNFWKAVPQEPTLLAGWLPSPSSDLNSRLIRSPQREPPKILQTLLAEQWVFFSNLPLDPEAKDPGLKAAQAFYQQFYQYDVVGITPPRKHRSQSNGWCCKILFGNFSDARAARRLHVKGLFMGKPGRAKTFRGGPDVHKALWDYRQSLPKDAPDNEVGYLLEEKYKQMHLSPAEVQRLKDYPTPESAVGVKDS